MSEQLDQPYDPSPGVIASTLAPQLGSDSSILAQGRTDMRRLTVIARDDMRFVLYATVRAKKSPVWADLLEAYANWSVSVGGRGRRDIIRMEAVSKGGAAQVESEINLQPPNVLARNIYNRDWKEKQLRAVGEIG